MKRIISIILSLTTLLSVNGICFGSENEDASVLTVDKLSAVAAAAIDGADELLWPHIAEESGETTGVAAQESHRLAEEQAAAAQESHRLAEKRTKAARWLIVMPTARGAKSAHRPRALPIPSNTPGNIMTMSLICCTSACGTTTPKSAAL